MFFRGGGRSDGKRVGTMNAQGARWRIESKVYQDEPLPPRAERAVFFLPEEYREMRRLAYAHSRYVCSEAEIFYRQGKRMERFEDSFDFRGVFFRYFPTYQAMDDQQLRGYFSWRTKVRKGMVEATSLSFAFVYVYELLNGIGVREAEEGFHTLQRFWQAYRAFEPGIDRYLKLWLRDYVVYHNLERSLLEGILDTGYDRAVRTLLHHRTHSEEEVFDALCELSSYDLKASRFYLLYPEEVRRVACRVFAGLSDSYERRSRNSGIKAFFGEMHASAYTMFSSAVFYEGQRHPDEVFELTDLCRYVCHDGAWSCERFFCRKDKLHRIGGLLKNIDFLMRRSYQFKSTLQPEKATKTALALITREIESLQEEERKRTIPEIRIDFSRLPEIREAALVTQKKLILPGSEESMEATDSVKVESESEPGLEFPVEAGAGKNQVSESGVSVPEAGLDLNETERTFLRCLLHGEPYEAFLRSRGAMVSILADAVNEKLFGLFGDVVIDCSDDHPRVLEEYEEELKGVIG